ncbi:MAG TPA: tetratricopeptide repeat protein [Candidatus Lustribacter sp.]|nr:tetratricopeptide repeat protein [Candidatus Lustribacter sp.]
MIRLLACAALAAAPLTASAQTATTYVPPKLAARGATAMAPGGDGSVTVQVLVKKDGSSQVIKVIKSSNAGDNAIALDIAKNSKYTPATRNGEKVDAYYDYLLNFGQQAAAAPGTAGTASALAAIRAGNYPDAESQLKAYLQTHPDDANANTLLGVADVFSGDYAGATGAFDKSGTVPDQYKLLAVQAYEKQARAALDAKDVPGAIALATRAIALNPQSLQGYYVRGNAYILQPDNTSAIADLQKAHAIAVAAKGDDKELATIAFSLAIAQLDAGQYGEAATTEREVSRVDGSLATQFDKNAYVAVANAGITLANQGKIAESVSRFESGASAFPASAADFYAQAATVMATDKKPDYDKITTEAEKATALDPKSGRANYILGIAAANKKDPKGALDYMTKAKASPAYGSDPALAKQIDDALGKLNSASKAQTPAGGTQY